MADAKFYIGLIVRLLWFVQRSNRAFQASTAARVELLAFRIAPQWDSSGDWCVRTSNHGIAIDVLRLTSSGNEQGWFEMAF